VADNDCDLIFINREQSVMSIVDVEQLIPASHPARLFWDITGKLDLRAYYDTIKSKRGGAGRPTFDPRLLITVWLYAYQRGIGSAREIERMCDSDPGMRWLTALKPINHHSLSDFRVEHDEALKGLFEQVLGMLLLEKLIQLERVTQDGTKILARVRNNSFRREGRLREHLEAARKHIAEMGDPQANPSPRQSAQERAAQERANKLKAALEEIAKLRTRNNRRDEKEPQVSETDPEARFMRTKTNGVAPCYNVQITTDCANGLIVDVHTTNAENDAQQLLPAMDRVETVTGHKPQQVIADGDYTNYATVNAMAERKIDFYGSWNTTTQKQDAFSRSRFQWDAGQNQFVCPEGKLLRQVAVQNTDKGTILIYRAAKGECAQCPHRAGCCGENQKSDRSVSRRVDDAAVAAFKTKMAQKTAREIYRTRSAVAEFPNLWIKAKFRLRQFQTQGLKKAGIEVRWAALTYNLQRYFQLRTLAVENA